MPHHLASFAPTVATRPHRELETDPLTSTSRVDIKQRRNATIMTTSFRIESTVRGHHVYKSLWTPVVGEELRVQIEEDNIFDEFVVAVFKDGNIVGIVP